MKAFWHYIQFLILIVLLLGIALIVSGKLAICGNIGNLHIIINQSTNTTTNHSEDWIGFLGILSTLLAAFFIYSSWKIDNDLKKISNVKESIKKIESSAINKTEFSNQLQYAVHYMMSKQYKKAIDALTILRAEPATLKDDYRLYSCHYFLAVCYYEQGTLENDIEYIAKSLEYINDVIESANHPLKKEILEKFEEMSKME